MKKTQRRKVRSVMLSSLMLMGLEEVVFADQQHYRNVITGERAQGLGGAYCGLADDASGVYYNPGGLAFAQSNDISGSANAFYSKKATYKKAILGVSDWVEESGGTFAPFFGAMQKLDKFLPGLVGGFAYYTVDTELKDQNSYIYNQGSVSRYHRAANQRASTYAATGAMGYRVSTSLGIGLSLGYVKVDELTQISQNLNANGGNTILMNSVRESLAAHGVQTGLGVQWAPSPKVALGFTAKTGSYASQKYNQTLDQFVVKTTSEGTASAISPVEISSKNPLGSMPLEMRAGVAWFPSPTLLITSDIDWHEAVTDMDTSTSSIYKKDSVLNYAVGTEYYVTPSVPVRLGFFTNNDATPDISAAKKNQPDHIDYKGLSIFAAWAQPNSQVSAGAVIQQGVGKAQKTSDSVTSQDVSALAYTLGFSATHNF